MFGDVADPRVRVGTKQWYTVPLSILAHTIGLGGADRDSVARDGHGARRRIRARVRGHAATAAAATTAATAARGAVDAAADTSTSSRTPRRSRRPRKSSPSRPRRRSYSMPGVVGGVPAAFPAAQWAASSAAFRAAAARPPQAPVRVGGAIKEPKRIVDAKPVYPQIAAVRQDSGHRHHRSDHRQGRVGEGSASPSAGADARPGGARGRAQWRYSPTLLNGQPVEVVMTVTVTFTLNSRNANGRARGPAKVRDSECQLLLTRLVFGGRNG